MPTDRHGLAAALERLAHDRDPDAWTLLVERCGPASERLARRLCGRRDAAQDAVQEAWLQIRDGARGFVRRGDDPDAGAWGWIMRVTANAVLQWLRREQRRSSQPLATEPAAPAPTDDPELLVAVRQALTRLPEDQRSAVVLHHIEGLDFAVVAAAVGCSVDAAKMRAHRGIERLRAHLQPLRPATAWSGAAVVGLLGALPDIGPGTVGAALPQLLVSGAKPALGAAPGVGGLGVAAKAAIAISCTLTVGGGAIVYAQAPAAKPGEGAITLRGYREVRWTAPPPAAPGATAVHRFTLSSPELAARFASKVLSDYELTPGNRIRPGPGGADVVELGGGGIIAPLLATGASEVQVVVAADDRALGAAAPTPAKPWLHRADLRHPLWMDKWDRHCLGMWEDFGAFAEDDQNRTPDAFFTWHAAHDLTVQYNRRVTQIDLAVNDAQSDYLRSFFTRYGVHHQQAEWLANTTDLYNRNPFLAAVPNPAVATRSHYYGERLLAGNPLRQVQERGALEWLKPTLADEGQLAILDPDGEIGHFSFDRWGLHGPMVQREFVRFLKEVRHLDLAAVSRRYTGDAKAFHAWEEVPLPDWRTFYGFNAGSLDLAGEWRFMRDDSAEQVWAAPDCDDRAWPRLHYPGDALVFSLAAASGPLWMRRTIEVPAGRFPGRALLSVAPLSTKPVQIYVDGELVGTIAPRCHTALTIGQFDVGAALAANRKLCVALRYEPDDTPVGPVFLTDRVLEDFPTADPLLNARRYDHLEFVDWSMAQAMGGTLAALRSLDPDRPIKVHAYSGSPWGWTMVERYGGFSHHTGSGPSWWYTEPKQYGASRGLQDSSEPGGPVSNLHDLKGLFGNLIYMGKNAHDYFGGLKAITRDPEMRAWFEAKMPTIRVMGRTNVVVSPIAAIRGRLNPDYTGEFAREENWRYGVRIERGGELTPLLDEERIREGGLGGFRVIVDEGTSGWDAAMTTALRAYVEAGGVLVLNARSGQHDFVSRESHPADQLAGATLGEPVPAKAGNAIAFKDAGLPDLPARVNTAERRGDAGHRLIPTAGTAVAATWSDGSPALTRRTLGKGVVWRFGSGTYVQPFTTALAATYGPAIWAEANGSDLMRTLVSNNGCEDLVAVRAKGDGPVTVTWHLDFHPTAVYDPATGKPLEATIDGNTVSATVTLEDWDFAWFAVRRPDPDCQLRHWFQRQTEIWSGTAPGQAPPAVPLFRHLDLNHGWSLARTATWEEAVALTADSGAKLKPAPLILWDAPGFPSGGPCGLYRNEFTLPAGWERDRLELSLRGQIHGAPLHGFAGKQQEIRLNGTTIWSGGKTDTLNLDVAKDVHAGRNRLEILHQGNGLMPAIMLVRTPAPESSLDLAGTWHALTGLDRAVDLDLPGKATAAFLYRDVTVPAERKDREVWLTIDGSIPFAIINGRLRYWDTPPSLKTAPPPRLELDITPDIRWGASNRIVLGTRSGMTGWKTENLICRGVSLGFYPPGRWSGTPGRAALTPRELAGMTQDLGAVQLYPLMPSTEP